KIADLASRTRENKATPDELTGGTFTITNTGSGGALFDTPILLQPQVAMMGVGAIVKRPVVVTDADGAEVIAIRSMVYLSLSYDHRLTDGADASRFLGALKTRIEEGEFDASLGLCPERSVAVARRRDHPRALDPGQGELDTTRRLVRHRLDDGAGQ